MKVTRELLFCASCFKNTPHTVTNFQTTAGRILRRLFLFFRNDTYYKCSKCEGVRTDKLSAVDNY